MPELPEVETTRRGIAPYVAGARLDGLRVSQPRLRWPVPVEALQATAVGAVVERVDRRAKYLLLRQGGGTILVHLGMSGSLSLVPADLGPGTHDHVDLIFGGRALRLNDPRRFGAVLWADGDVGAHPLLARLGVEPLGSDFSGALLRAAATGRRAPVKQLIMNAHVVVGVGNIYASEALFRAGIHPRRPAGRVSLARYERLATAIRDVLGEAITAGGTTLRDFVGGDGRPGYFTRALQVYGRAGEPCVTCGEAVRRETLGQRSTFFCSSCQR
ncbi:MAG: bifunctional DNA-formamidopyrimidine glycosylase/DNA-(apurinic or apyrimidinic site) lyase [Pseudomonadota bacterium]